jgi:DNA-binding MarR family transcriptional regulator
MPESHMDVPRPPAGDFLLDQELIGRLHTATARLIWCMGCQMLRNEAAGAEPVAVLHDIIDCTGLASGTATPIVNRLVSTGVVESGLEEGDPKVLGRPLRRIITVADTEMGRAFRRHLAYPAICPLLAQSMEAPTQEEEIPDIVSQAIAIRKQQMTPQQMARRLNIKVTQLLEIERTGKFRVGLYVKYLAALGVRLTIDLPDEGDGPTTVYVDEHLDE